MKDIKDRALTLLTIAFAVFACIGLAVVYVLSANSARAFDNRNNTQTVEIKNGETFMVVLNENPTTGYAWVMNVTSGLAMVSDTCVPPGSSLAGTEGQHEWLVKATGAGNQKFSAIYKRPNETLIGNEASYTLHIKIV